MESSRTGASGCKYSCLRRDYYYCCVVEPQHGKRENWRFKTKHQSPHIAAGRKTRREEIDACRTRSSIPVSPSDLQMHQPASHTRISKRIARYGLWLWRLAHRSDFFNPSRSFSLSRPCRFYMRMDQNRPTAKINALELQRISHTPRDEIPRRLSSVILYISIRFHHETVACTSQYSHCQVCHRWQNF